MTAQIGFWTGAFKTLIDLLGPDSPGAQPYGGSQLFTGISITTLTGSVTLGVRPTTAPKTASTILAQFSGAITGNVSVTLPVPSSPAVLGDYLPGDIVRVLTRQPRTPPTPAR